MSQRYPMDYNMLHSSRTKTPPLEYFQKAPEARHITLQSQSRLMHTLREAEVFRKASLFCMRKIMHVLPARDCQQGGTLIPATLLGSSAMLTGTTPRTIHL